MTLLTFAQYIIMKRESLKLTIAEASSRMSIASLKDLIIIDQAF